MLLVFRRRRLFIVLMLKDKMCLMLVFRRAIILLCPMFNYMKLIKTVRFPRMLILIMLFVEARCIVWLQSMLM